MYSNIFLHLAFFFKQSTLENKADILFLAKMTIYPCKIRVVSRNMKQERAIYRWKLFWCGWGFTEFQIGLKIKSFQSNIIMIFVKHTYLSITRKLC